MEKSSVYEKFSGYVDQLRNTECSQKEKIACFQHIAECIMSPAMAAHINYAAHCGTATNVLLLFCEDLDSVVRMSAEENLNKIFRALEKTRVSRILMDLYGEIKRNGNQRSLRICLNLFAYYSQQIKEKHVKWYAVRILQCLSTISQRKETLLQETLCEFVKTFGKYLQQGLTDSESYKLFEVFLANISADCAVKRRCSAQNCITFIENARNKSLMAKHGLNKVIELLLSDQKPSTQLGALGFLRLLLPLNIRGFADDYNDDSDSIAPHHKTEDGSFKNNKTNSVPIRTTTMGKIATTTGGTITGECQQIVEIYDYCLHLLSISSTTNHGVINAALEVINAVLQALEVSGNGMNSTSSSSTSLMAAAGMAKSLRELLCNQQLQHNEYLRRRKSLKNQIFQLKNYETVAKQQQQQQKQALLASVLELSTSDKISLAPSEVMTSTAPTQTADPESTSVGQVAYKLGMQKNSNAKMLFKQQVSQQQQKQQQQQHPQKEEAQEEQQQLAWHTVGINVAAATADDVNRDDEGPKGNRNSARSISECVVGDDDDNDDAVADADAAYNDHVEFETAADDEEDDDFTTLSEINEPQNQQQRRRQRSTELLTTKVDVDNLIDAAIDAKSGNDKSNPLPTMTTTMTTTSMMMADENVAQTEQQPSQPQLGVPQLQLQNVLNAPASDDKSQHLSDIDNESFNSIDFDAEITIGGLHESGGTGVAAVEPATTAAATDATEASKTSSSDTIGSFLNNLISHSNAATESVSKLFNRQSSGAKTLPLRPTPNSDKSDALSTASLSLGGDTLSITSLASSEQPERTTFSLPATPLDDSYSVTASITASTAVLADTNTRNTAADCSSSAEETGPAIVVNKRSNANPFLEDSSPLRQNIVGLPLLTAKIGSINEQAIICYTARLIAARFLLTGQPGGLQEDAVTRVSIKSLSLVVFAQCVRLMPHVLQLTLEISAAELHLLVTPSQSNSKSSSASGSPSQKHSGSDSSGSQLSADYEQVQGKDCIDLARKSLFPTDGVVGLNDDFADELLMLEIKDDHFGKSTCAHLLHDQPKLSRSADPVLLQQQLVAKPTCKLLSKSEIVTPALADTKSSYAVTVEAADTPPSMLPPRPPKRTKSIRKSNGASFVPLCLPQMSPTDSNAATVPTQQQLQDVLHFYAHADPILRGGVQMIVGNFIQATGAGLLHPARLNLQHLLAILLKGLEDEIHTVVIQALNAFDKIFPHVVSKYLTGPPCHYHAHQQQQQQQQCRSKVGKQRNEQQKRATTAKEDEEVAAVASAATTTASVEAAGQIFGKQTSAQEKQQDNALSTQQQQQQQRHTNDAMMHAYDLGPGTVRISSSNSGSSAMASAATVNACKATSASWTCTRTAPFTDNDELVVALLNDFQLQSYCKHNNEPAPSPTSASTSALTSLPAAISPKLLLSKLRLCHHNKYWLVQNKYAEVISNLNYDLLRTYYETAGCDFDMNHSYDNDNVGDGNSNGKRGSGGGSIDDMHLYASAASTAPAHDDIVCTYETKFLDELLHLIGDDDTRVREHAAACLCRFIIQTSKQQRQNTSLHTTSQRDASNNAYAAASPLLSSLPPLLETQRTNFNLLWDFFDYRIFGSMSVTLRNLFRANAAQLESTTILEEGGNSNGNSINSNSLSTWDAFIVFGSGVGNCVDACGGNVFSFQRQMAQEEKVLAKVLYRMTNKLMTLNDKNLQFGIIYALRLLLRHFNYVMFERAWSEYNFMEICMKFSYYNNATAADLNCQNDLIDVMGKLMAGAALSSANSCSALQSTVEYLLGHCVKLLNVYYHIFTQQKPLQLNASKPPKTELFTITNAREAALLQAMGYFGSDYVYMKLYNILRGANDSYKITINQESGSLLIALLKTCLQTLSLCIELRSGATVVPASAATINNAGSHVPTTQSTQAQLSAGDAATSFPSSAVLKLIEEILHYLTKLINYAPGECVACLRQLLKYLFAQNYGNRHEDYHTTFIRPYFVAKRNSVVVAQSPAATWMSTSSLPSAQQTMLQTINPSVPATKTTSSITPPITLQATTTSFTPSQSKLVETHANYGGTIPDYNASCGELFVHGLNFYVSHASVDAQCAKHIKLFEPLVVYCLTLFMKSNATVQAPILELLSQLLELNVTYSILDSKNVIFDQILNNLDLIESGIARTAPIIIPPMLKFLMQLTHKSDRKLITIPKIISITNNLLANAAIRDVALLALKTLSYELFFMGHNSTSAETQTLITPSGADMTNVEDVELDTQKEVVLGMLEKFIDAYPSQQLLGLLLLYERSVQQLNSTNATMDNKVDHYRTTTTITTSTKATTIQDPDAIYALVCRAMRAGHVRVNSWHGYFLLEAFFRNNGKYVLADSKEFMALLQLLIEQDVGNFSDLSYATIILENVILKTEEIYLVNHIKLYLKNKPMSEREIRQEELTSTSAAASATSSTSNWLHEGPSTSSAAAAAAAALAAATRAASITSSSSVSAISEINYFAKVLCEKLVACLTELLGDNRRSSSRITRTCTWSSYCGLVVRFVNALQHVCCRSLHKAALQSVFRLVLTESEFLCKYYNLLLMSSGGIGGANNKNSDGDGDGYENNGQGNATPTLLSYAVSGYDDSVGFALDRLLLTLFRLLLAMRLPDPLVLLSHASALKWPVQRSLLREVCLSNWRPTDWQPQQVRQLFDDGKYLNFLIADHFGFLCNLSTANSMYSSLLQDALLQHVRLLNKHSIRSLLRLLLYICRQQNTDESTALTEISKSLRLLGHLHRLHAGQRSLQLQLERLARRLFSAVGNAQQRRAICESLATEENAAGALNLMLWNDLEQEEFAMLSSSSSSSSSSDFTALPEPPRIIDESWLFGKLIKFATESNDDDGGTEYAPQQLMRILLEIQSENKLQKIFNGIGDAHMARLLRHAIDAALRQMLATFRNSCIQHNPHIHYMQPNPLARAACAVLMARIGIVTATIEFNADHKSAVHEHAGLEDMASVLHLARALCTLLVRLHEIEKAALIYIDAKFIDKFLRDNFLRSEHIKILYNFLHWCCARVKILLLLLSKCPDNELATEAVIVLLSCIDALLQQRYIWQALNNSSQPTTLAKNKYVLLHCQLLDVLWLAARLCLQNTIFYKRHKVMPATTEETIALQALLAQSASGVDVTAALSAKLLHAYAPKAIFIAKLIETQIDIDALRSGDILATMTTGTTSGSAQSEFGGTDLADVQVPLLPLIAAVGISLLRTNYFFAYAVTPHEIIGQQQQQDCEREQQQQQAVYNSPTKRTIAAASIAATCGKLPTIPVEWLSDVDVLRKFVKRLSIFGFTTRQQFEEYFMTFLLLINKVYDEHMVDQQEQFQIKSVCLQAIMELLITYKTFPIVGAGLRLAHSNVYASTVTATSSETHAATKSPTAASAFHHTPRWQRINCDRICLKKLHKVQMIISDANVFYQSNLERNLATDNVIGTRHFELNQYDLNFIWQQMEHYTQPPLSPSEADASVLEPETFGDVGAGLPASMAASAVGTASTSNEDAATRNYRYFTQLSGIDFRSSTQLVFDVLMQMVEQNHVLVLPNLMKFCEICESRDQIKWIKERALKLQEIIPMDDTISHQHLIYLLCKTQAMLIPTLGELQHLCTLIGSYLKSSHVFIRNATLAGVLSLLECCTKTNTTIGKLSDELAMLRDLILGYINRHGIIDESPLQFCETHTKLVWTLNYCLIEWTSKFVPQCHLMSNTIIAASNFLKRTDNEDLYLCVLHGLERMVVNSGNVTNSNSDSDVDPNIGSNGGIGSEGGGGGIVSPLLRHKIEKLALELLKMENEKFSIPALKLLLSCIYVGSSKQLENTELSNGIVQDDPEIIAQQTDKVDILLHCIKSSTRDAAWIYGQVLCQIIRDLVPPNEILTKVIKEFLAINQPHCDVIAMIVYQVFRSAIDSSFLQMLQDWLICTLPTFLSQSEQKGVWGLSVIFLSASINLHLIKLFPVVLSSATTAGIGIGVGSGTGTGTDTGKTQAGTTACRESQQRSKLGQHEIALFVTAAQDFHAKLSVEQKIRFRDAFKKFQNHQVYAELLQHLA